MDALLKQRTNFITNLIDTIKGVSKQKKETLIEITLARNNVLQATSKKGEITTNKKLSVAVNKLFLLKENPLT